jgi:hypothetical protein
MKHTAVFAAAAAACCALTAAAPGRASKTAPPVQYTSQYSLVMLPNTGNGTASDAMCIDGTPIGFYWQEGWGLGANNYMVYFQGACAATAQPGGRPPA